MNREILSFCLGVAALISCLPTAPIGADAFQKGMDRCTAAKLYGPILDGQSCPLEGLTCNSNGPACNDTFDDDTERCTGGTYLPCTCTRSSGAASGTTTKWTCPTAAQCPAPEPRCTCPNSIVPFSKCYKEGLNCPDFGSAVDCINQWNPTTKVCENYTIAFTDECNCYQGEWLCVAGDPCRFPSYECDPDFYPDDYSPS